MWTNITPVPNAVFDIHLKDLKATELKILLVIIRQTLGWENKQNKTERKESDWISSSQLAVKTGSSYRYINTGIQVLIEKNLIDVLDEKGNLLALACRRQGKQKLFFRLASANFVPIIIGMNNEGITPVHQGKTVPTSANSAYDLRKKITALTQKMRITK